MKNILLVISFLVLMQTNLFSQNSFQEITGGQVNLRNFIKTQNNGAINFNEGIVGSRFIFKEWANGSIITVEDSVFNLPSLFLNYDKYDENLVMKQDENTMIALNKDKVKLCTLRGIINDTIKQISFERVDLIKKNTFFESLVKGTKYSLYKYYKTKFTAADFKDNGIVQTGSKYDTYEDAFEYYVVSNDKNEVKKIELKKKAIKQSLNIETAKVDAYFNAHKSDAIDEDFLKGLVLSFNQ